jgi:hypothetical protein
MFDECWIEPHRYPQTDGQWPRIVIQVDHRFQDFRSLLSDGSPVLMLSGPKGGGCERRKFGKDSVTVCTKMQQSTPKMSPNAPLRAVASYT